MKSFLFGLVSLAIIGGGIFYYNKSQDNIEKNKTSGDSEVSVATSTPSLEDNNYALVINIKDNAYLIHDAEKVKIKLGDKLTNGSNIITDNTGKLTLQMPDKSELRLAENTNLTLDTIIKTDDGQTMLAYIDGGRVWSKVKSLTNSPSSAWQIQTSNAVATVRGTSFGIMRDDKNTRFVVGESKVSVYLKNKINKTFEKDYINTDSLKKNKNGLVTASKVLLL